LRAIHLSKCYPAIGAQGGQLRLFRELNLEVVSGEMVAVVGRSGAGKSSLLHLLAGLDRPTQGEVWVGPRRLNDLSAKDLAEVRNRQIGYVWQFHYLLPEFTALENVGLPLRARGVDSRRATSDAQHWLERVGLAARAQHRAGELSGGEQQRVAIARALVTAPAVLLADEPTGDLDEETGRELFDLLRDLCREAGLAAVLVTHNTEIAFRCDRVLELLDGTLRAFD
jgi:lipoprotein-releasing system ATP-binding protein